MSQGDRTLVFVEHSLQGEDRANSQLYTRLCRKAEEGAIHGKLGSSRESVMEENTFNWVLDDG